MSEGDDRVYGSDDGFDQDDEAFYANFNYLNPDGIEVDYECEFPDVFVRPDPQMENVGDNEAEELTRVDYSMVPGNDEGGVKGSRKRRTDDGFGTFKCFYCAEPSDKERFYIPDKTPSGLERGPDAVIDRAFCLPECAMGWIVYEAAAPDEDARNRLIAGIHAKAGRYVKCPLPPYELLCRGMDGMKLRAEAVIGAKDQAPENYVLWDGVAANSGNTDAEEEQAEKDQETMERRLNAKAAAFITREEAILDEI